MTQLGINLPTLIIYLLNFGILLAVLYLLAYKPLLRAMDQRSDRIKDSLAAADRAREEAANSQAAIEEQLNEARREGQRLLDQAKVAAVPGIAFGADNNFRISYATSMENIQTGMARLGNFCKSL